MEEGFDEKILDFAIAGEVGSYRFYMRLSEQQTDATVADLFRSLAEEAS